MVSRAFNQGFWLLSFIEKQLNKYLDTLNCMNLFFLCLPQLAHANVHPAGWVRRGLQVSSRTPRSSLTPHRFPMVSHRGPQLSDMGRRVKIGYQICCCRIYFGCISVSLGLTVILNHTVPICWRGQTVKLIICVSLGRTDWLAIFCIHLMGYGSLGYMFFLSVRCHTAINHPLYPFVTVVGGLEHFDIFFPSYWECHHPNCYSLHDFSEGLVNHQPAMRSVEERHRRRRRNLAADSPLLRLALRTCWEHVQIIDIIDYID